MIFLRWLVISSLPLLHHLLIRQPRVETTMAVAGPTYRMGLLSQMVWGLIGTFHWGDPLVVGNTIFPINTFHTIAPTQWLMLRKFIGTTNVVVTTTPTQWLMLRQFIDWHSCTTDVVVMTTPSKWIQIFNRWIQSVLLLQNDSRRGGYYNDESQK